jgi:hypothetical protein
MHATLKELHEGITMWSFCNIHYSPKSVGYRMWSNTCDITTFEMSTTMNYLVPSTFIYISAQAYSCTSIKTTNLGSISSSLGMFDSVKEHRRDVDMLQQLHRLWKR